MLLGDQLVETPLGMKARVRLADSMIRCPVVLLLLLWLLQVSLVVGFVGLWDGTSLPFRCYVMSCGGCNR